MWSECSQEFSQNVFRIQSELVDMQLSLSNFSVFSSFCLFIFLSFRIIIFLSFRLSVFLSFFHLSSSQVIGGRLRLVNHERASSTLYVGNGDGIGLGWMEWLSEVIGILRAPSVLIIEEKKETGPFLNQVNLDILKFLIVQLNSSAPLEGYRIVLNSKDQSRNNGVLTLDSTLFVNWLLTNILLSRIMKCGLCLQIYCCGICIALSIIIDSGRRQGINSQLKELITFGFQLCWALQFQIFYR